MKKQGFDDLAESIREAGRIGRGEAEKAYRRGQRRKP
jgi:hypothetical protein